MSTKRKTPVTKYNGNRIRHLGNGSFMADFTSNGGRKRKCFPTLAEAKTAIDQWKIEAQNKGRAVFSLADRDRLDVAEFRKHDPDMPLATVFDFWTLHHPAGDHKTIEQVIDEFLLAPGRRGTKIIKRREATTEGHRKRLLPFGKTFNAHPAHEVTQTDIETWLDVNGWTGLNRKHYLSVVRALFAFAVRKGYVGMNPAEKIETPEADTEEPIILTVDEAERYLHAIENTVKVTVQKTTGVEYRVQCADLLPREAIAFFCGLRPEELTRLDWKNISIENKLITVSGDVAKIQGHRRNVQMPDNLLAWLAPYVRDAGPVWPHKSPTTLVRYRAMAREAACVDVPDNAGRHAFASYHLAAYENAPATAEAMGHADIKLLRNTYRNITASDGRPITTAGGQAYFEIRPKRAAGVIQFRKTA